MEEIVREVRELVYTIPLKSHLLREEDCAAFLLWFDPLIPSLVKSYKFGKASFETFLRSTIVRRLNSFYTTCMEERTRDLIACSECAPSYMADETPENAFFRNEKIKARSISVIREASISEKTMTKRLLTYYLSLAPSIKSESIEGLAKAAGLDEGFLAEMLSQVMERNFLSPWAVRSAEVIENKNVCYAKMIHFNRLSMTAIGGKRIKLEELSEVMRMRLHRRISGMPQSTLRIHHEILAEVLGIPVGTVAYNIHYVKKLLEKMDEDLE